MYLTLVSFSKVAGPQNQLVVRYHGKLQVPKQPVCVKQRTSILVLPDTLLVGIAVGPDGGLKDAADIDFYESEGDDAPILPST
jgi:hypothetical protein